MASTSRAQSPTIPPLAHAEVEGAGCAAADASVTTVCVPGVADLGKPSDSVGDDDSATETVVPMAVAGVMPPRGPIARTRSVWRHSRVAPRHPLRLHEPAILGE